MDTPENNLVYILHHKHILYLYSNFKNAQFLFVSGFINYMEKQKGPPTDVFPSQKELKKWIAMQSEDIAVVGFFENEEQDSFEVYQEMG